MKKIIGLVKHPLFSGSIIMIFGRFLTSSINYFYHLILGRLLGPSSYGELAVLISLVGLINIIPTAFGLSITRLISQSHLNKEVGNILNYFNKKIIFAGILLFIVLSILSPLLTSFLHLSSNLEVILMAVSFIFSISAIFSRAVLQGLLKFGNLVFSQLSENINKLLV